MAASAPQRGGTALSFWGLPVQGRESWAPGGAADLQGSVPRSQNLEFGAASGALAVLFCERLFGWWSWKRCSSVQDGICSVFLISTPKEHRQSLEQERLYLTLYLQACVVLLVLAVQTL